MTKTSKTKEIDLINVNDEAITDKNLIPNIMNTYFCRVWENVKTKIPHEPNHLSAAGI